MTLHRHQFCRKEWDVAASRVRIYTSTITFCSHVSSLSYFSCQIIPSFAIHVNHLVHSRNFQTSRGCYLPLVLAVISREMQTCRAASITTSLIASYPIPRVITSLSHRLHQFIAYYESSHTASLAYGKPSRTTNIHKRQATTYHGS